MSADPFSRSRTWAAQARRWGRACALALALLPAAARAQEPAHPPPQRTPQQLIDELGMDVREALQAGKSPDAAEQAVADQISALIQQAPGQLWLTAPNSNGQTPLMLAVSGAHLPVVRALLTAPAVRLQINSADKHGETAWMVANFALSLTLVACQPGTLTLERAPLLPPYLRRMAQLLRSKAVTAIVEVLAEAGGQAEPAALTHAWLARCPNATTELRTALDQGDLLPTLIQHAAASQVEFNRTADKSPRSLPEAPPADMQFVVTDVQPAFRPHDIVGLRDMHCRHMPTPQLAEGGWSGAGLFKVVAHTRAGIVEAADVRLMSRNVSRSPVTAHLRRAIMKALGGYVCAGDTVFEQEFQFR